MKAEDFWIQLSLPFQKTHQYGGIWVLWNKPPASCYFRQRLLHFIYTLSLTDHGCACYVHLPSGGYFHRRRFKIWMIWYFARGLVQTASVLIQLIFWYALHWTPAIIHICSWILVADARPSNHFLNTFITIFLTLELIHVSMAHIHSIVEAASTFMWCQSGHSDKYATGVGGLMILTIQKQYSNSSCMTILTKSKSTIWIQAGQTLTLVKHIEGPVIVLEAFRVQNMWIKKS